jgi:acyl carrier protein
LPDDNVEFLGRVDDQVKIRGFRIEPGEVRAVVAAHGSVRDSFIAVREDSTGEGRLVAYVVPSADRVFSLEELRRWVKTRLPDYMVPSALVLMKALPLTPNGKIDRNALPEPEQVATDRSYLAPRTPAERIVAEIWAEVLRVERVGVEDNFFDLGGHSLQVTQVIWRMRKAFQQELPIRWLFESPTVAQLAARAETAEQEEIVRILEELESLPEDDADRGRIGVGGRAMSRRQRTGAAQ